MPLGYSVWSLCICKILHTVIKLYLYCHLILKVYRLFKSESNKYHVQHCKNVLPQKDVANSREVTVQHLNTRGGTKCACSALTQERQVP